MGKRFRLFFIVFGMVAALSACGKSEFEEAIHNRSENYGAIFDMMSKTDGHLTVGVENKVWNEEKADIYFEAIQSDYEKLIKAGGNTDKDIRVYIVESTIGGGAQTAANEVYCTIDDIESLTYRPFLTQAVFGFSQRWKREGLSDYIFGETQEKSDEEIKVYCESEANQGILSLIPPYFSEDFATDEQVELAKSAALSLTKYTLENSSIEEYVKEDNYSVLLQSWLENIGLTGIAAEDYSFSDRIKEDYSNSEYPMTLIADNMYFYLEPRQWAENADQLYDFFRKNILTVDGIKETLYNDGLEDYIKNFENTSIYINVSESLATITRSHEITLGREGKLGHELIHIIIPVVSLKQSYLAEGIATHFGTVYESKYFFDSQENQWIYDEFINYFLDVDLEKLSEKDYQIAWALDEIRKYYSYYKPLPKTIDEFDLKLYWESAAISTLMNDTMQPDGRWFMSVGEAYAASVGFYDELLEYEGNNLSYAEASIFVEYLIDTYDALTVADVTSGKKSFEEGFGKDYDTVFAEFMSEVKEKYRISHS